jgi:hypothetical protein
VANLFKADRIFSEQNHKTGIREWFFQAREGMIGPYETREVAERMMKEFIARCIANRDDGGRSKKSDDELSLAEKPTTLFDPMRKRRGIEDP